MKNSEAEIQEASWTAAAELVECFEQDDEDKLSLVEPIVGTFQEVLPYYQGAWLMTLLDLGSLVAKRFRKQIYGDNAVEIILKPILEKWSEIGDNDKIWWVIMQSLKDVIEVLKDKANFYITGILEKSLKIINAVWKWIDNDDGKQDFEVEFANRAFLLLTEWLKHWSNSKFYSNFSRQNSWIWLLQSNYGSDVS